jgi:hypothetical protein
MTTIISNPKESIDAFEFSWLNMEDDRIAGEVAISFQDDYFEKLGELKL